MRRILPHRSIIRDFVPIEIQRAYVHIAPTKPCRHADWMYNYGQISLKFVHRLTGGADGISISIKKPHSLNNNELTKHRVNHTMYTISY